MTATVRDVVAALETAYPPELAASWDAVGLVCGDPAEPVHRVVIAVDPVAETVGETLELDAQLLVTHHPLLLRGVHGVPADDPKGGLVHRLVRAGVGLFCAHTNADAASPGVSDALARALGLRVTGVLEPRAGMPHIGTGRICELAHPESLAAFTRRVRDALPETAWGVRAGGDPERAVRTVAVCGGAGDSLLSTATAAGADVFLTADLRHHPASEHLAADGPALVDVAHWASEHPWCAQAAAVLTASLGSTVDVHVSYRRTDPWTIGSAQPLGRPQR
ncbi:MAG TPA: Nif3-like dinuclear metal center hexameric protein [Pseudonocardiaceae bacterium]|nr:Nif3-like dinuclear metal center hexameric protein [Pseudonocardiaceae bacterium]